MDRIAQINNRLDAIESEEFETKNDQDALKNIIVEEKRTVDTLKKALTDLSKEIARAATELAKSLKDEESNTQLLEKLKQEKNKLIAEKATLKRK